MKPLLEERKECFTDHGEILAFHRLKKEFDAVLSSHRDDLPANPLEAVMEDFQKDKALIDEVREIDS